MSFFRKLQLFRFSQPACDRAIYRLIKRNRIQSIVEVGLVRKERTLQMIQLAHEFGGSPSIRYTGVDLFEAAEADPKRWKLVEAHKAIGRLNAKTQLVPGTLDQSLPRIANSHLRTDLIVISGNYQPEQLAPCWFYLPRMLTATSVLMLQPPGQLDAEFEVLTRMEVERFARKAAESKPVERPVAA